MLAKCKCEQSAIRVQKCPILVNLHSYIAVLASLSDHSSLNHEYPGQMLLQLGCLDPWQTIHISSIACTFSQISNDPQSLRVYILRTSWVQIPAGFQIFFFRTSISHSHNKNISVICGSPGQKSNIIPLRISTALPRSKRCNAGLLLRVGLIHAVQTCQVFISYIANVSPTHNGSAALQHLEHGTTIEIHNGIIINFYLGLPHTYILVKSTYFFACRH